MSETQSPDLRRTVFIALFTALIIIGGYIAFPIPFSPVPIVLADFFVVLAGLCLGASGAVSVGLFLFLGALGLPVFAGGKSGLAIFMGPTGGFLIGYLLGALACGWLSHLGKPSRIKDLTAVILANLIVFSIGMPWLKVILKVSWDRALALGLLPFLPGNLIKMAAAFVLIQIARPVLRQVISDSQHQA